jgi:hypothetical protein
VAIFCEAENPFPGYYSKEGFIICEARLIFAKQSENMSNETNNVGEKDFTKNWVNSSRFLFYLQVFCMLAFVLGGCYRLYHQRYKGKPDIEIQGSSKYTPEYK